MDAIRLLAANDLRRRWRSAVLIALLVAVVGAIVLATAAGARRSATSLDRFNALSRSSDLEVDIDPASEPKIAAFERAAGVSQVGLIHAYGVSPIGRQNLAVGTSVDGSLGTQVDRARLIKGREINPNAPDEITIGEDLAQQAHLGIGGVLEADSLTPRQLEQLNRAGDIGALAGPHLRLRVVGIVRRPLDLGDQAASGGVVIAGPAFDRAYHGRIALFTSVLRIHTPRGEADLPHVIAVARKMFGHDRTFTAPIDQFVLNRGGQDAIDVLTAALWIFAAVAAAAGLVAITIVISRDAALTAVDQPTLRSMGMTRRDRLAAAAPRASSIAVAGSLLGVGGALALSPLFPVGISRRADPNPGWHIDWVVAALGVITIAAFVAVVELIANRRATRAVTDASSAPRRRGLADAMAPHLRPTIANGVRMALDPGRNERTVPLRSAFVGAIVGIIGVVAVLVVTTSLQNLVATPRLYGWGWDLTVTNPSPRTVCDAKDYGLSKIAGVGDVAAICSEPVAIDGRSVTAWGFTPVRGAIQPTLTGGRLPLAPNEIALGPTTLEKIHRRIGDTVRLSSDNSNDNGTFTVVGRILFPQLANGDVQPLADGAITTQPVLNRIHSDNESRFLVARLAAGANRAQVEQRIAHTAPFSQIPPVVGPVVSGTTVPPEVDRLRHVAWFPPAVAVLVGMLALIAVAHALITSVRRRRQELAILKALGFARSQVRSTVAWEATTIAVAGLAIGIPAGLLLGRSAWGLAADSVRVASAWSVPVLGLALIAPCALLLVNAVSFFPARAAANAIAADALATE